MLIASPLVFQLPLNFQKFNLQGSEELEQYRLQKKADTAQKINQLGIMPEFKKLKIRRYQDNPNRDPKPDTTGYLEDEVVVVYDSLGQCIGKIQSRKWYWKYHYRNTCKVELSNDS
jgi:hypothetical protein